MEDFLLLVTVIYVRIRTNAAPKANSFLLIPVRILFVDCLFNTLGRIAADATAKKTIVQLYVLLVKGKPHFARVNCSSFTISAIGKRNVIMTEGVLDKVKRIVRNRNQRQGQ